MKMTRWSTRSAVVATGVTETFTGSRRRSPASEPISFGMVAEKNRLLPLLGKQRHDAAQRLDEAHVQHLVGLVEHEDLDLVETDRTLLNVVDETSGRRDEDVDAPHETVDLRTDRNAAEDRGGDEAEVLAVDAETLGDLAREFPRRRQDQGAAGVALGPDALLGEAMQDRQGERGGLTGAGLRNAEQGPVPAWYGWGMACAWIGVGVT